MNDPLPVRLVRLPLAAERADHPTPAWVFDAVSALDLHWQRDVIGSEDLHEGAEAWRAAHLAARNSDTAYVVALPVRESTEVGDEVAGLADLPLADEVGDGTEVLGYAALRVPLKDNPTLAFVDQVVRHDVRRRGIGTRLDDAARAIARDLGRTTLQSWTGHQHEGDPERDALTAPTGVGSIARDATTEFALIRGYRLEQTERHSVLEVPTREELTALGDDAAPLAVGYRTLGWVGATPEEHLDDLAELYRRMSIDVPMAELELDEEVWDAQRVRDADATAAAAGRTPVTTLAVHEATGTAVAFTILVLPKGRPEVAWQDETLVHGDHRGHRLGMLVKAHNLLRALDERPDLARVHTWNAGENEHMLAINEALGFQRQSTEGAWQLKV